MKCPFATLNAKIWYSRYAFISQVEVLQYPKAAEVLFALIGNQVHWKISIKTKCKKT